MCKKAMVVSKRSMSMSKRSMSTFEIPVFQNQHFSKNCYVDQETIKKWKYAAPPGTQYSFGFLLLLPT